jgi:hypothetical protein
LLHDTPPPTSDAPQSVKEEHLNKDDQLKEEQPSNEEDEPCGICLEPIQKYGLLSSCPHTFCFTCIMEWRSSKVSSRRVCPTCRKVSNYVMPSNTYPKSNDEKENLLKGYKRRMASRPCKKWTGELGSCPFGRDCFYSHCDANGVDIKGRDRSMQELYEERERNREEARGEMELEMIQELIMMGMSRGLIGEGFGGFNNRRRGQRDRSRGGQEDDSDFFPFELPFGGDHFFNQLLNHFVSEHMRHDGVRSYDSESNDDDDDYYSHSGSDDSSMPELENVPRRGDGGGGENDDMPPLMPNHRGRHERAQPRDQQYDDDEEEEESEWESIDESGSSDGSMPPLEDANILPAESDDDDSMPELEDMPAAARSFVESSAEGEKRRGGCR